MSDGRLGPHDSGEDRAKNIAKGVGSLTVQNLATSLVGFFFLAVILRLLPPVQYDVYSAIIVSTGIAVMFATFGLNQAVARYLALLRGQDEQKAWAVTRRIIRLAFALSMIVSLAYGALAPYLSIYFTKSSSWTGAFLLSGLFLFLYSFSNVTQGIIQGLKQYVLLAKILLISRIVMLVLTITGLFLYANVVVTIIAWIIYFGITIGWILALAPRSVFGTSGETLSYSIILKYCSPLAVASIVGVVASTADIVVVGGYLNPNSLGVYNAAVTISNTLSAVMVTPLTTAFLPEISSSRSEGDISNGLRLALRFVVLVVLPGSLFVATVPAQLISLFSGRIGYLAGSLSLELIAGFYGFLALQLVVLVLFQATGKTSYVMLVGLLTAILDIGVSVFLVPELGLLGAACAKISVAVVGSIIAINLAKKYLRNLDNRGFYLKGVVTSTVPFLFTLVLSHFISARPITLLLYGGVFFAIFLICLKAFGLLTQEDRDFLVHVLPKSLRSLISHF
jgi:O-antigen/teichoic acid export membrane protein